MDKFIEICQDATYCMRTPQQDSAGWFLWLVWGGVVLLVLAGLIGSRRARVLLMQALFSPTEYRGRMGRESFLSVYYSLQALRAIVIISTILAVSFLGKTYGSLIALLLGGGLLMWFSVALYCSIIRRGHDFNLKGTESFLAYLSRLARGSRSPDMIHTWRMLREQKGNPFANRYGSAPQENNYLIPPENTRDPYAAEFPPVWDETDWKNWKK